MPIYEYKCIKCGKVLEHFIKNIKKTLNPLCFGESCNGEPTERIVSGASFQLKGGGWYKDGYTKRGDTTKNIEARTRDLKSELNKTKKDLKK